MSSEEEKHSVWAVYFAGRNEPRLRRYQTPVTRERVFQTHPNAVKIAPAEMPEQSEQDAFDCSLAARAKIRGVA